MTSKQHAKAIMNGIHDPEHHPPSRAIAFITVVADQLCKGWKDPSKHEQTCAMLYAALGDGRLALKAEPHALVIIDGRTGEFRVRVPL